MVIEIAPLLLDGMRAHHVNNEGATAAEGFLVSVQSCVAPVL